MIDEGIHSIEEVLIWTDSVEILDILLLIPA